MKNILCTSVLAFLLSLGAQAQLSSNVQIGYLNTLGTGSFRSFGIGGGLQKAISAKFIIGFTANLYIGGKADYTDTAIAFNTNTEPPYVLVDIKRKAMSYTGSLEMKYYLVGDAESDMGVYAMLGIGALKWAIKTKEIGSYDEVKYGFETTPYVNDLSAGEAFGPAFGAGFEKNIGNMYFFANGRFLLPLIGDSDPASGFDKPKSITLEAGLRFPF